MPITLTCEVCSTSFEVPPSRNNARACSHACAVVIRGKSRQRRTTLNCKLCGKAFDAPNAHAGRRIYCSRVCAEANPERRAQKAAKTAENNPAWKGGKVAHADGYVYEMAKWHPLSGKSGYVLQHRLVMERWLLQNDPASKFLEYRNGHLVLSPEYEVHHKDENKANNSIDNLECLTPAEHRRRHSKQKDN